jgi:peptidyl-prolyl cis-trans isomerase D
MKYFLWFAAITFVAFIFLQWGMNFTGQTGVGELQRGILAKVNGRPISVTEYQNLLSRNLDAEQERLGRDHDELTIFDVEEATYEQLVRDYLVRQILQERQVRITDEEVVNVIRFQPPPELRNDTLLQTDGQFDPVKYQNLLQSPQNLPWLIQYEALIRDVLPRQKLDLELASLSRTTQGEVERALEVRRDRVRLRTLYFNPGELPTEENVPQPGESELQDYFEIHREDFEEPEKVQLKYVVFPRIPSSEDEASVLQEIKDLLKEIEKGALFEDIVRDYSEDPGSREEGGDLGFIEEGQLEPALEEAIASLKPGGVSEPVRSSIGWHLLKLVERRKGERRVSHVLLRVRAGFETLANIEERANSFREEIRESEFDQVAETYELQVNETPAFAKIGDLVPGVGFSSEISDFAFTGSQGEIRGPISTREGFFVLKLIERKPEYQPSFEEVKTLVSLRYSEERKLEETRKLAEEVLQEIREGKSLHDVYRSGNKKARQVMILDEIPLVTLLENEHNLPREVFGSAYTLEVGGVSGVVGTDRGFYVVELLEKKRVEPDSLQSVNQNIADEILLQKREVVFSEWMSSLLAGADIQDYRNPE